jgi:hypothetical protein
MPNRILKESICTSDTVDALSAEEERLFTRLITKCDDFGCFDARPAILRAECFPLKVDQISLESIAAWATQLAAVGLIRLYAVDGRPYLQMVTWRKHQQARAVKPKYPLPDPSNKEECAQLPAIDSKCNQIPSYSYSYSYSLLENDTNAAGKKEVAAVEKDQNASADAPPNGGISLLDQFRERLKADGANRLAILQEAHIVLFGRTASFGRLGKMAKQHGAGEVLQALFKTAAHAILTDDPLDYAEGTFRRSSNSRPEPHYLDDAESEQRRKEDEAWKRKVLGT